ncbi:MAG: SPOR domain-containing protein [Bacteroidales bacterium]|nr:SPOR domain-containing protein [Bacteroidales bacterium]
MIRIVVISFFLVLFSTLLFGQSSIDSNFIYKTAIVPTDTVGEVVIFQQENVQSLLDKKIEVNKAKPYQMGYRLQIMSVTGANSRDKVNMEKAKILMEHKDVKVYIVYNSPYFKVRLGDFRTKLDAVHYLQEIIKTYPQAFVVRDKVNIPYIIEEKLGENNSNKIE